MLIFVSVQRCSDKPGSSIVALMNYFRFVLFSVISITWASCAKDVPLTELEPKPATPYALEIPAGFPQMNIPADNPMTVEGIALGRKLFYDKILSKNNAQSCGSCHNQANAFSDNGKALSSGADGSLGTRNAQALVNPGFNRHFFWDGRVATLEEQALQPVKNPVEMHQSWATSAAKINARPDYVNDFKAAFGYKKIDSTLIVKALAQFMRTMISSNSRFDKYVRHEVALTPSELNGFVIFNTERGDCFHCHNLDGGFLITDNLFHNNGLDSEFADMGLGAITGNPYDAGKFLTPSLRNIALSAPYMHDGRFATLEEVINHYNMGGEASLTVDPLMKHVGTGLNLSAQERADLLAFLHTFTDEDFINDARFSPQE